MAAAGDAAGGMAAGRSLCLVVPYRVLCVISMILVSGVVVTVTVTVAGTVYYY